MSKAIKRVTSLVTGSTPKTPTPVQQPVVQTPTKDVAADAATEEIRKRRASSGQKGTILAGASSLEGTQATKKTLLGE